MRNPIQVRNGDTLEDVMKGRKIGLYSFGKLCINFSCRKVDHAEIIHKILNDNNIKHTFKSYKMYQIFISTGSPKLEKITKFSNELKKVGIKSKISEYSQYKICVRRIDDIKKVSKYCRNPEIIERVETSKFR